MSSIGRAGLAVCVASVLLVGLLVGPATAADQVSGAGSTSAAIALLQWQADAAHQGIPVNFSATGSSTGRRFYIEGQVDFAVSELPFQRGTPGGPSELEQAAKRPYAYVPLVAGGLSLAYNLTVDGHRISDLRLSSRTVALIFTGRITNWNDPAIVANSGHRFPSLPIRPIIRDDGSYTSYLLTSYIAALHPRIWRSFCDRVSLLPCEASSLYPSFPGAQAQQGSDGVASAVAAPFNNGAITYVEYGYAKQRDLPTVALRNRSGAFVQPTGRNVAAALRRARTNPDGTQRLERVYRSPNPRAYPLSSYTYMIVPTSTAAPFTTRKGDTLGRFLIYALCAGQLKADGLGYSPLPTNLIRIGFDAVRRIPGAPPPPRLRRRPGGNPCLPTQPCQRHAVSQVLLSQRRALSER